MTIPAHHTAATTLMCRMAKSAADARYAQLWASVRDGDPVEVLKERLREFEHYEGQYKKYSGAMALTVNHRISP